MKPLGSVLAILAALIGLLFCAPVLTAAEMPLRTSRDLSGAWLFQRNGAKTWKEVTIPSTFQSHEGTEFHGVGWYKKSLDAFEVPNGKRVLLHFQAAATYAEVWWNGEKLGSHLGGWTPFRFDVTDLVKKTPRDKPHEIRVKLDEKVGHNTQGFLPIVEPHYGGLWQGVQLLFVPETHFDDLKVMAMGDVDRRAFVIELPPVGDQAKNISKIEWLYRLRGEKDWARIPIEKEELNESRLVEAVPLFKTWSPAEPNLYECRARLFLGDDQKPVDEISIRAAFRKIEAHEDQLRLNGVPLQVRGILNWGYYPPNLAPNPSEKVMRQDIELAKSMGFNLMKFCLWMPPQRFFELCDEMGLLAWEEYPTWHPDLTKKHLDELKIEFGEFFAYDRNHPAIILRSLTCETGPSAELDVIKSLYEQAHQAIPGSLVEDDSSWIGWNRISDFWDDHPYGNNHTWVKTLQALKDHIAKHGKKPLILGEAIAADTWAAHEPLATKIGKERPYWVPGFFDANQKWLERMRKIAGPIDEKQLVEDSKHYAILMRKFQIETLRREIPNAGYVVSVIRDFPLAGMGLIDYLGEPKWPVAGDKGNSSNWSWHDESLLTWKTKNDRWSVYENESHDDQIILSHFGPNKIEFRSSGNLESDPRVWKTTYISKKGKTDISGVEFSAGGSHWVSGQHGFCESGTVEVVDGYSPAIKSIDGLPHRWKRTSSIAIENGREIINEWNFWAIPKHDIKEMLVVSCHKSVDPELQKSLGIPSKLLDKPNPTAVVIARRFDDHLLELIERGAKVLLLPDGQNNSFPLAAHWFLRGGPVILNHPALKNVPRQMLVELQHFDLAGDVIPDIPYLEQIDPIFMLWDNHDMKEVKTHGLVFETKVGKGRLLVSALNHKGETNAAGHWLLYEFVKHLASGPEPKHGLSDECIRHLREKLHEQKIELVKQTWRFKPDPKNEGLKNNWHKPQTSLDDSWKDIKIGKHWEAQGYPDLDGWAWYRLAVEIPKDWKGREVYLNFEGVDDFYELYVNGQFAGKGGDLEKKITAFDERKSQCITKFIKPGETCILAVRVNDFQGAGGIHRPITLSTMAWSPELDVLK